ncbi:hypothetical protein AK812_SmicGene35962 [Symbiodinium microadriaticum]|uniref:Uncharacterized protein n=1 Tax=Symbiodinium microadriaticum TaxID=2951 RepID=A0A1Q9CK29_SYMMI|nr:hypothetical protein AK812_SmicGene35962 [Symbiodinium microadriaticum]
MVLEPWGAEKLGFTLWGRTRTLENKLRPFPLSQRNYEDGKVLGHIDFLENRKLCAFLLLDAEGSAAWH